MLDVACASRTRREFLLGSAELATPAPRAVGALRGPSKEGVGRLLVPEIGPFFALPL